MNTLAYQEALQLVRAEFSEMPDMRLTPQQVERLSGADRAVCQSVLEDLVRAEFLTMLTNGRYGRVTQTSITRRLHSQWHVAAGSQTRGAG